MEINRCYQCKNALKAENGYVYCTLHKQQYHAQDGTIKTGYPILKDAKECACTKFIEEIYLINIYSEIDKLPL